MDVNKMMTNGIFTMNDKLTQAKNEQSRMLNSGKKSINQNL